MQLKGKGVADIRALFAAECPGAADGISKPNKEEMQRKIATARVRAANLTEATSLAAVHSQLTQDLSKVIKSINGPPSEADSELGRAGFCTLSKLVTATSTSSEIQCREIQTEVLAT